MKHKTATSVALRQRRLKSGNISLYLDIYTAGRRSYEYLNLYLTGGSSRIDRENDRQTLALAEAIRAKRLVELRNGKWGFDSEKGGVSLHAYLARCVEKRRAMDSDGWHNWANTARVVALYERRDILLSEIDKKWAEGFKAYLSAHYKPTSAGSHYRRFRCAINEALAAELLQNSPLQGVKGIPSPQPERCYLTIDEVRELTRTQCDNDVVRRAFLFCCLTGLRRSDVERLEWTQVSQMGEFTRITFVQKKTGGLMYLDISDEAVALMGNRAEGVVFKGLPSPSFTNLLLKRWALDAGIRKNISFHTARHTFATMMLTVGVDLYTTSKLLGHTNVATTQIYAKIVDKSKQDAVKKLPSILSEKR